MITFFVGFLVVSKQVKPQVSFKELFATKKTQNHGNMGNMTYIPSMTDVIHAVHSFVVTDENLKLLRSLLR